MGKLFFLGVFSFMFLLFLFGCQNAMESSELQEQNSPELNTIDPQCEEPPVEPPPCEFCECKTPGYWKNHLEAWPVDEITVGCETYTAEEAIALMSQAVKGDKSVTMFKALVAAKLNIEMGCSDSCIPGVISAANIWMCENPLESGVKAKSDAWQCDGEDLYWDLDDWNNDGC